MSNITVILTAYRRPNTIRLLVDAIRGQSAGTTPIWIWANDPTSEVMKAIDEARPDRVVTSSENAYFHARFALALTAATEFVAIFDDDSVPGPRWFENCLGTMDRTPGILGAAGVRLHDASYATATKHGWHEPAAEAVAVDLVGHAWFLPTRWLHYLFAEPAVLGTNGEDIELAARAMRLGAIPCYCPPHPTGDRTLWGSTRGTELGDDPIASFRRSTHVAERDQIVRTEIEKGWRPLFMRGQAVGPANFTSSNRPPYLSVSKSRDSTLPVAREERHDRHEEEHSDWTVRLIASIPEPAKRILIVGCGDGSLGTELKKQRQATVEGIETDRELGDAAKSKLDRVYDADPLDLLLCIDEAGFDCVICDCFDRFRNSDGLLRRVHSWLKPDGRFIAVTANVRHHATITALIEGRWTNGNGQTNGRGHKRPLRFYTRREFEKALFRAGFKIADLMALPGRAFDDWVQRGRPNEVRIGPLHIAGLANCEAEEYHAGSFLVAAARDAPLDCGLTSIVLVLHNQLEYTRQCVESIGQCTDEPYELIFIDNASTDGTAEYLGSLPGVHVISNAENRGFPKAANQGIQAATGRQILLLNNDTLVTTGWLRRLLRGLYHHPRIGLIGPCSNHVSGSQCVSVSYEDLSCLDGFAWDRGKSFDGIVSDTDRLVGFCLLMRREVVERIGLFDEQFSPGNFEDDDYCLRAIEAGFRVVIARDSFVHHFGERTFAALNIRFDELMAANLERFRAKLRDKELARRARVAVGTG